VPGTSDQEIRKESVGVGGSTICRTKRHFMVGNLEAALSEEPRPGADARSPGNEEALPVARFRRCHRQRIKRWHEPQRRIGDLLEAELARSIKHQLAIAKLPLTKELADSQFKAAPINEAFVRAYGHRLLYSAISCWRVELETATHISPLPSPQLHPHRRTQLLYTIVNLINRLEAESRSGRH
jgi:hypothetical protein